MEGIIMTQEEFQAKIRNMSERELLKLIALLLVIKGNIKKLKIKE